MQYSWNLAIYCLLVIFRDLWIFLWFSNYYIVTPKIYLCRWTLMKKPSAPMSQPSQRNEEWLAAHLIRGLGNSDTGFGIFKIKVGPTIEEFVLTTSNEETDCAIKISTSKRVKIIYKVLTTETVRKSQSWARRPRKWSPRKVNFH